jgi:hypothetical protein
MLGIVSSGDNKIVLSAAFTPPKYNRLWGADYMLMDSNSFMGGVGGNGYDNIIDLYTNLWNSYQYQLFSNLRL